MSVLEQLGKLFLSKSAGAAIAPVMLAISPTATGAVYTLTHRLNAASALGLAATGTNSNLSVVSGAISVAAALGAGVVQIAQIRESYTDANGILIAEEYPVYLSGGLALSAATYLTSAAAGTLIGTITGLFPGETITTLSIADGTLAIAGSGTTIVTGLTASTAGTRSLTLTSSTGRTLTQTVTASTLPAATTITPAYSAISTGFTGPVGSVSGSKVYLGDTVIWAGYITGTDAFYVGGADGLYDNSKGIVDVSIDGSAFIDAPKNGNGEYILFTGQTYAQRRVVLRCSANAYNPYVLNTGNVFRIVGNPPSVTPFGTWQGLGDSSGKSKTASALLQTGAVYSAGGGAMGAFGGDPCSIAVRGDYTTLAIATSVATVYVSVDGADPQQFSAVQGAVILTGLSGLHSYYIWACGSNAINGDWMCVGGLFATGAVAFTGGRLDQYGDSITAGVGATNQGAVDVFAVAAKLGRVGSAFGWSGQTPGQIRTSMAAIFPRKTITSNDVAVLAAGRNGSNWQADYQGDITDLLSAGYGKVICRGLLKENGQNSPGNSMIQAAVAAVNDARVKYVDVTSWPQEATADGVHPTDAGYATLVPYEVTAYTAALS